MWQVEMSVENGATGRYMSKARELRTTASQRSGAPDREVLLRAANAYEELAAWNQRVTPWELAIRAELHWEWEAGRNRRACSKLPQ